MIFDPFKIISISHLGSFIGVAMGAQKPIFRRWYTLWSVQSGACKWASSLKIPDSIHQENLVQGFPNFVGQQGPPLPCGNLKHHGFKTVHISLLCGFVPQALVHCKSMLLLLWVVPHQVQRALTSVEDSVLLLPV
jgi:hypothetical protein